MKLITFILFAACLQVSAEGLSQTVTISVKNEPLEKVFSAIEKQTGYFFTYTKEQLASSKAVTVDVRGVTLTEVLDLCFKEQPLTYQIIDSAIIIKAKEIKKNEQVSVMPPIEVRGRIVDENGNPVLATVTVKGTKNAASTDENGFFVIKGVADDATLVISAVNIETYEVKVNGRSDLAALTVKRRIGVGEEVTVTVNTGYQQMPKERATGSFVFIDSTLINRRVSTNILDRLEGVTPGLIFNKNRVRLGTQNQADIAIRGRSTLFANPNPLIILDNFPYDGDLSTINPNDIESITVLKDAAAASIWGASSGNGVIVITTKKGRFNQALKISVNTNVTVGDRPDLWYTPRLNASDYVDVETFLFNRGNYNSLLGIRYFFVSPVVEILHKRKTGLISAPDSTSQIDQLRNQDIRNYLDKYIYRKTISQQYNFNVSGGGTNNRYFFSAGFDKNAQNLVRNEYNRITIRGTNIYSFFDRKLDLTTSIAFNHSLTSNNNTGFPVNYPYYRYANDDGTALSVTRSGLYRKSYVDTAGGGKLLDWSFRPLEELYLADNTTKLTDYHIKGGLAYKISKGFEANIQYEYSNGNSLNENFQSQQTFFTRDLINQYTQINLTTGEVTRRVPLGGIMDMNENSYYSHQGRGQITYNNSWSSLHSINAIAGFEIKSLNTQLRSFRFYGYNEEFQSTVNVDNVNQYPLYQHYGAFQSRIPGPSNTPSLGTTNNYLSYFFNAGYTFKNRYLLSASVRRDESNIYGVKTNQKGVPLWSAGLAWEVSREEFYQLDCLPYLKLRITNGYNGNSSNTTSALLTTGLSSGTNSYNANFSLIRNAPNAELRWEKVNILNVGIDFEMRNKKITGSIEYYSKTGKDILGNAPISPQTGNTLIFGNVANIKGNGLDVVLNSFNINNRHFKWNTTLLFNYALDKVSKYNYKLSTVFSYLSTTALNPLEEYPIYSVYSWKWAGLDSVGNPRVYLDGKVSSNYTSILSTANFDNLRYNGPATPPFFGSIRNTFSYNHLSFSFNIVYKFGYYFRASSISIMEISSGLIGHPDYQKRWQKSGDENFTNIPSMIYPLNSSRESIYRNSDILVEKGDHIRLQDIQIGYDLNKKQFRKLPFQSGRFYLYINNLGLLWKANDKNIDPDYIPQGSFLIYPNPKTYSMGVNIDF